MPSREELIELVADHVFRAITNYSSRKIPVAGEAAACAADSILSALSAAGVDCERKADALRFRFGQPVQVASTYRFANDWLDVPLWIAGIDYCPVRGHSYRVADAWPVPEKDWRGHIIDDFSESDLSPRPPSPETK